MMEGSLLQIPKAAIFLLANDSLQLYLATEQLKWANGITASPDGTYLFVASGRYGVIKVNTHTRKLSSATNNKRTDYAIDGLVLHSNTLYAAIGWPQDSLHQHRILRYYFDSHFNFTGSDTLAINQSWLQCPTTLAVHNNKLFALGNTNLGIYNRHQQKIDHIRDSLLLPAISIFSLSK